MALPFNKKKPKPKNKNQKKNHPKIKKLKKKKKKKKRKKKTPRKILPRSTSVRIIQLGTRKLHIARWI